MTEEIWKDVQGYEGLYQVSNLGRVKSFQLGEGTLLNPSLARKGYLCVELRLSGKRKRFRIHRLVAMAFIPNIENKPEVNHINGIKTDNRIENLEWVTHLENISHAWNTGLGKAGEDHYQAAFTNEQVLYIRNNPDNLTTSELGRKFEVDSWLISLVQTGKTYKNVGGRIREKIFDKHKLPANIRNEIRSLYVKRSSEFGSYGLAKKFGVNHVTILNILKECD